MRGARGAAGGPSEQGSKAHDNVAYRGVMGIERYAPTTNAERHRQLAGAWLASFLSGSTRRAYAGDLRELFEFLDKGGVDALLAERRHLDVWRSALVGADSTVGRKLSAASSFYRYAEAEGRIASSPMRNVRRPKVDADFSATRGLTKEEAQALIAAAAADTARSLAYVSLLLLTGVRSAEALGSDVPDLQHDAGHRVLIVTRKGGKRQKIVLPAPVLEAFAAYLGAGVAYGTELARIDDEAAGVPIFTTSTGKRWVASEAFRTVQRLATAAGIEGVVSPHSLRHTHATIALDEGVALVDLQDSMGHADPRTTRRYDRARGRLERASSYAVAAALSR